MTLNTNMLTDIPLFHGITEDELVRLDTILAPRLRQAHSGEFLSYPEDILEEIGIVLSGKVYMVSEDFWGNQNIIAEFAENSLFGEAHSITLDPMFFSLVAVEPSVLLYLNTGKILSVREHSDSGIQKLYHNLMTIIIRKKLNYMKKADLLSRRSLREKISAFLSEEYQKSGTSSFRIPYNRQQLADYLSVDRSALSKELSKMKKEGIIEYNHNWFQLKSL
nr:Crp/Fnr family transcriptional regulator [uncultured Mediterraneibacter sp.]